MTKVILSQDQHYIDPIGQIKCGKDGECINADESFLQLIEGKYTLPEDVETEEVEIEEVPPIVENKPGSINFKKIKKHN